MAVKTDDYRTLSKKLSRICHELEELLNSIDSLIVVPSMYRNNVTICQLEPDEGLTTLCTSLCEN